MEQNNISWKIATYSEFLFCEFEQEAEVVMFATGPGSTHVVDLVAAMILQSLKHKPQTRTTLIEQIKNAFQLPPNESPEAYIDLLLRTLQQQNLIQPILK